MHHGSCLCQGVTFTVSGELPPIQVCYCSQCRRAQGGPVATNMPVQEAQVTWLTGQELMQRFESSPGKQRCFCKVCGSPLFSQRNSLPGVLRLRAGLLAEPVKAAVAGHFYHESKAGWWPILLKKSAMVFAAKKYALEIEIFTSSKGHRPQISRNCALKERFH